MWTALEVHVETIRSPQQRQDGYIHQSALLGDVAYEKTLGCPGCFGGFLE